MEREVTVKHPEGLHARPATEFVGAANRFQSKITVVSGNREGNARSILSVLGLGIKFGQSVVLRATGPDEELAIEALAAVLEQRA